MKKKVFFLSLMLITVKLHAIPNNFDIYGVDESIQKKIYSVCSDLIEKYASFIDNGPAMFLKDGKQDLKLIFQKKALEDKIIAKVKQLSAIDKAVFSSIYYPQDKKNFITLDLVKKDETYRIPNAKRVIKSVEKKFAVRELFNIWKSYNAKYLSLIAQGVPFKNISCPVMHCIYGFDETDLKETLPKLQQGLKKYRTDLINIIQYSSNNQDRADAIFILANDLNYQDAANFLVKYIDDTHTLIRNNVMRVLAAITIFHKVNHIDINLIIDALNYPDTTDRNKASAVLYGLVINDPTIHWLVIDRAGRNLMTLLKLKQPNNHDYAYKIFKEISRKNYPERDYSSWEKWLKSQTMTM